MKLLLEDLSLLPGLVVNATYRNEDSEDIYLQFRMTDVLENLWRQMDTEIRRLIADKLAPTSFDDIDELYKDEECTSSCGEGAYCSTYGHDK